MAQSGINNTFKLIAKYRTGKEITSYGIEDTMGVKRKITKAQMCFLMGAGLINNYSLTFFKNKPILRSLSNNDEKLPEYADTNTSAKHKYKIIKEIVLEGRTIGFDVALLNGNSPMKLKIQDVYKLVKNELIAGVSFDEEDKDVLKFENENDIYNINVYDINTNIEIPRINIFIDMREVKMTPTESNLTAIGNMEFLAFGDKIEKLKKDVKVVIDSFSYNESLLSDISRHNIRIRNTQSIFDIRSKADLFKLGRIDILNIIATVIQRYDINAKEIKMTLTDNNNKQNLGNYIYKVG